MIEITNYRLEDGEPLVAGIPYNVFEKPRLYVEVEAGQGQREFNLGRIINVVPDNPLYVYVNGVQTMYKGVKDSEGNLGTTGDTVVLYAGANLGDIVSFLQPGVPRFVTSDGQVVGSEHEGRPYIDILGKYPRKPLLDGHEYYYNSQYMRFNEYCYAYGRALRRAVIPVNEWRRVTSDAQLEALLQKYIGYEVDVYTISPNNVNDFPYAATLAQLAGNYDPAYGDGKIRSWIFLPYNLEGVTVTLDYVVWSNEIGNFKLKGGYFQAFSPNGLVNYLDRFFPGTFVYRAEAALFLNRLRKSFYRRFTDTEPSYWDGSAVVTEEKHIAPNCTGYIRLHNRVLPDRDKTTTRVYVNGERLRSDEWGFVDDISVQIDTKKIQVVNGDTIEFYQRRTTTRFVDIEYSWMKSGIMEMELERYSDGKYLLEGTAGNRFNPYDKLTRAEAVVLLNRFRKWAIERFKM